MKLFKLLPLIILMCVSTSINAQIFKKLGKKLGKVVERTIEGKAEEKTARETSKAFDSTFNNPSKTSKTSSPFNIMGKAEAPAGSYAFTHKYVMRFNDGKKTFDITYFLSESGNYMGSKYNYEEKGMEDMIMVIDATRNTLFTFMTVDGKKTVISMGFDINDAPEQVETEQNISFKKTGRTKTILKFLCEEYTVKSQDSQGSIWITKETEVRFLNLKQQMKGTKKFNQKWLSLGDGLVMEMDMVDTSRRKPKPMKMVCTALETINYTLDTSEYGSLYKN
ncbi:DUF4412 domain-containing protein [Bizionia saleffrena]|uniref:DUF4412 domain-containing protein n=1 Tax=Bizionia saleffrena TaxID=291189 RepID=A0A8H2QKU3_9FLAO|nr:DUF4412 domain-containing protein [Bizionia saleffrena]TYB72496.1 DUF4412 domain-containing protein [Bizionia saleffrena]